MGQRDRGEGGEKKREGGGARERGEREREREMGNTFQNFVC